MDIPQYAFNFDAFSKEPFGSYNAWRVVFAREATNIEKVSNQFQCAHLSSLHNKKRLGLPLFPPFLPIPPPMYLCL